MSKTLTSSSPGPALTVEGLTKLYGGSGNGVRDLKLSVPRGSLHGFLGRNGAGKTTTMKCIMGLLRRDKGRFSLFGEPYDPFRSFQLRRRIGYSPELPTFPAHLKGREVLEQYGRMRGLRKTEARYETSLLLRQLELTEAADQKAMTYSKGMKAKLGIAIAMLGDPELLILDEPTSGLDPVAISDLRKLLRGLVSGAEGGRTVLLSSHQMYEVQQLCTSVTIIDQGVTKAEGHLIQLMQQVKRSSAYRAEFARLDEPLVAAIRSLPDVSTVEPASGVSKTLRIQAKPNVDLRETLARLAVNQGTLLLSCEQETLAVEDVFLSFVQA
ncbi:MAG TPA: ABC transporter ATP-binding protein [Candidatus Bathyarchaeia archaeon]|nr:ABC transporter ATP-binding protein [Candidatus Bathyarchaeia archaeon]